MWKKLLTHRIREIFQKLKGNPRYQIIKNLPKILRIFLGSFCLLYGVVAVLTPLPVGSAFCVLGSILILGRSRTRAILFRMIDFFWLDHVFVRVLRWWNHIFPR